MSTAVVTPTIIAEYTWDSYQLTWDDVTSQVKSWDAAYQANFTLDIGTGITVTDTIGKGIAKSLVEPTISIADSIRKGIGKNVNESITVTDSMSRIVDFIRILNESITVTDSLSKDISITKHEYITVISEMLRSANAVISDILIDSGDMTLEEFNSLSVPVGYEQFRTFANGDYDYQKALIRIIVEATVAQNRPLLDAWKMIIDVEDVNDRGSVNVPVDPIRVLFNKTYHEPPEVNITIKSCADINAKYSLSDIDETGFTICLYGGSGSYVAGTISWFSVGF